MAASPSTLILTQTGQMQTYIMNWQEFFSMGGYGLYVWMSYGLMAVLLVYNIAAPIQRKRHLMQHLKSFLERESNKTRREDAP